MAERAKSDEINPEKCIRYATRLLGTRQTPFFTSQALFATETATLAKNLFLSRQDSDYICRVSGDDICQQAQVIWAATLLSQVCQSCDVTYDDICDVANPEVAGYLQWVLPDRTISLLEGTARILSQLAQRNTYANCGPIFVVLAKALITSVNIGDGEVLKSIPKQSIAAFSARLWNVHNTLQQLWRANVQEWSPYVRHCMEQALKITTKWKQNDVYPDIRFRCGETRHCVDWRLDMTVPEKNSRYKEFTEL